MQRISIPSRLKQVVRLVLGSEFEDLRKGIKSAEEIRRALLAGKLQLKRWLRCIDLC